MKILQTNIINKFIKDNYFNTFKTKPYPNDMVCLSRMHNNKLSFKDRIRMFFGLHPKLNAKSFASGKETYRGPYVASKNSVRQTNDYIDNNIIDFDEKIINGFRDAGRDAKFTKFGDIITSEREIITIDREYDDYLNNIINYVRKNTQGLSEKEKVKRIYNIISEISEDTYKSTKKSDKLAELAKGREVMLGKIFEHNAVCCRHKGLMFKILCDEIGIKASLVRGNMIDMFGFGGHVWNEVKLSNGKKLLIDTQNHKIIDITKPNPKAATYFDVDNNALYYH